MIRGTRATEGRKLQVICSWCEKVLKAGDPLLPSHGVCAQCAETTGLVAVESLVDSDPETLDRLPFGVVRLRGSGEIIA